MEYLLIYLKKNPSHVSPSIFGRLRHSFVKGWSKALIWQEAELEFESLHLQCSSVVKTNAPESDMPEVESGLVTYWLFDFGQFIYTLWNSVSSAKK